jgi:restriction endonuclease S subunit
MEAMTQTLDLKNIDKAKWESFRFDEIAAKISETVDPNTTELEIYVGLEHIDAEDIHIKRFGTPDDVSGGKLKCYPGDVIFGKRRAYQRKAAVVEFEGICSAHAFVLRANPDVIDPQLFPFFLHSDQFMHRMVDISVGGLSPTINWGDLKHQEFLLPPKDKQAELAELFWAMDEVIERNEQLQTNYNNFLESSLNSLIFGQFGYFQMKKTKIGEIPNNWNLKKLGELCVKIGDGIHKTPEYVEDSEYLFVNGNNLIDNKITKTERTNCVSYSEFEKYNKRLAIGTILLSINGTIGNLAFYNGENVVFGKSVAYMGVNENELDPLFLYYLLQTKKIKTYFERELTGSTISNLSLKTIRSTPVPLPLILDQKIISQKLNQIFKGREAISKTIISSKSLQKSLINQIF